MAQSEGEFDFGDDDSVRRSQISQEDGDVNPNFTHQRSRITDDHVRDKIVEEKQDKQVKFDTRIGGNYMKVQDPTAPPYTPFYLMITGQIASGQVKELDGICCSY
jgi:hypothetical protein